MFSKLYDMMQGEIYQKKVNRLINKYYNENNDFYTWEQFNQDLENLRKEYSLFLKGC